MNIRNSNEQLLKNYNLNKDNSLKPSNSIKNTNDIRVSKEKLSTLKTENSNSFKLGDEGSEVSELQNLLKNSGYFKGVTNGYYGKETESAVKNFQKSKGIKDTGVIDVSTKVAIAESRDFAKTSAYSTVAAPMVRSKRSVDITAGVALAGTVASSWNENVYYLQVLCNQYGISVDTDGKWGINTENAVRKLPQLSLNSNEGAVYHVQNVLKIPADGQFGPATKAAVENWQRQHGLTADGIVGADTWISFSGFNPVSNNSNLMMIGSRGDNVRTAQMKLIFMGYNCGTSGADGEYGSGTADAVRAFQGDYGLSKDGVIGDETLTKINFEYGWRKRQEDWAIQPDDPTAMENKKKLDDSMLFKQGDQSKHLEKYQQKLKELGFYNGEIDGNFGNGTYNAVRAFQGSVGLSQDGVIGENTIKALNEAKVSSATRLVVSATEATQWLQILCNQMGIRDSRGNSLPQNGEMTQGTVDAIKQLPVLSTSTRDSYPGAVKHIQNLLKIPADGDYGTATESAVRIWQSAHGISSDGIVGEATWETFAGQKLIAKNGGSTTPITPPVTKPEIKDQQLLAYQQDIINMKNSNNVIDGAKHFAKYLWDRFPGLWSDLNEQHALSMGMEPEYAKLAGELSTNLLLENLTAVTVNGIRGYKNIKTGNISYDSNVIAGSGLGNIAKGGTEIVYDISKLSNTGNFREKALEHILEGELNARGLAVGFHYEGIPTAKGMIIPGTESAANKFGIYTAKVEVSGVPKVSNRGQSSFFPKNWSAQDIVNGINEAYTSKQFIKGTENTFRGLTSSGMMVEMYIDKYTNKIISAFPVY